MTALAFSAAAPVRPPAHLFAILTDQQTRIAQHALAAWDGETLDAVNGNLKAAKKLLQELAQTARAGGYGRLCTLAEQCEMQILVHLDGPYADLAICPGEIIWCVDTLVEACSDLAA